MKTKDILSIEQQKCVEAVQRINNKMHDKEGWQNHDTLLDISICGFHYAVDMYIGKANVKINLFNSGNDNRIFYEKSNKYEEWYTYLKRMYREAKTILNDIKL